MFQTAGIACEKELLSSNIYSTYADKGITSASGSTQMLNCRLGNNKKVCLLLVQQRKKEIGKFLYSTFILFMYTWIFYTQATHNMYLNNIQQCTIELVQYFGFQEVFSFLSST